MSIEINKNKQREVIVNNSREAFEELKEGNRRFLAGQSANTNYLEQIEQTKNGHQAHSVILSCMDARVPPEIIFDQGIGNVFVIRNAGNLEDENVLGSLEYSVHHSTAKLIVVMGHSHCGAVTGALNDIEHGHLSQLVEQIKPAIKTDKTGPYILTETAKNSVLQTISDIEERSESIRNLLNEHKISIIGAYYETETGEVFFFEHCEIICLNSFYEFLRNC